MSVKSILSIFICIFFPMPMAASAVSYDDDTELKFIWTPASGNVDHYNVYVSIDEDEYILVGSTAETFYIVEGEYGHTYRMKVQAADAAGNVGSMSEKSDLVICGILGDVSLNNDITAFDAALVIQYIYDLKNLSYAQIKIADVTDDGTVGNSDADLILQYAVGLITQFTAASAPIFTDKDENQLLIKIIAELENTSLTLDEKSVLEQLKQLLWRQSIPTHTTLLQNYPNPFNPETWIPFELAQNASVSINIYDIKGQLIRTISLGKRNAGVYVTKDKAASWDGRNNLGEKVSSGVYYYTLQARNFSKARKMIIIK